MEIVNKVVKRSDETLKIGSQLGHLALIESGGDVHQKFLSTGSGLGMALTSEWSCRDDYDAFVIGATAARCQIEFLESLNRPSGC